MSDSFKNYEYILDQEALCEVACDIMAELSEYIANKGFTILDTKEDIVILYWQISEVKNNIVDVKNNNTEKLSYLKGYLMYISNYIELLGTERKTIECDIDQLKNEL